MKFNQSRSINVFVAFVSGDKTTRTWQFLREVWSTDAKATRNPEFIVQISSTFGFVNRP